MARGQRMGRPPKLTAHQQKEAIKRRERGEEQPGLCPGSERAYLAGRLGRDHDGWGGAAGGGGEGVQADRGNLREIPDRVGLGRNARGAGVRGGGGWALRTSGGRAVGRLGDSGTTVRKIGHCRSCVVGTPSYFAVARSTEGPRRPHRTSSCHLRATCRRSYLDLSPGDDRNDRHGARSTSGQRG